MTLLLPIAIQTEYKDIMTAALVNVVYKLQYEEILLQHIEAHEICIKTIFSISSIALGIWNLFSDNSFTALYISIILSIFIKGMTLGQKLIYNIYSIAIVGYDLSNS